MENEADAAATRSASPTVKATATSDYAQLFAIWQQFGNESKDLQILITKLRIMVPNPRGRP